LKIDLWWLLAATGQYSIVNGQYNMGDILVFAEHQDGKVKKTSFELVSKAVDLAKDNQAQVIAILIGSGVEGSAQQLAPYGANKVAIFDVPAVEKYNTIAFANVLKAFIDQVKPSIVLATASPMGRDLFPRLAAKLKVGLASDSTELRIDAGKLIAKRPVYSGKAFVEVVFNTDLQLATARPNSFPIAAPNEGAQAEVLKIEANPGEIRCPMKEQVKGSVDQADLTEAEIIVSGGRAMANAENFKILQDMAVCIGATVGASRAAVDSGYAPHDMQVGQTGKVVNPKLYFAFGISGAIQHLAGMRTSKVIVAINKDADAPIFSKADYGIVGDLFTLVPLLTDEFKKVLSE